jgi:predicted CXXCH cytochrome family protein
MKEQTSCDARSRRTPNSKLRFGLLICSIGIALFVVISCGTLDKPLVMPPSIPGAEFVGNAECATCHEDIVRGFGTATHSRMVAQGANALHVGCESCHGPGSLHVQAGGGHQTMINPARNAQVCFQCHLDVKGRFNLPYRHPVLEGKMTCSDCHEPHKADAVLSGGTSLEDERSQCGKCHIAQRGPFVFEHEAVREGCTTCHAVHGSVNNKLLLERGANLCFKCHFQRQSAPGAIFIGDVNHSGFLRRGTCWSGGCHEAVHGSQVSPTLRF